MVFVGTCGDMEMDADVSGWLAEISIMNPMAIEIADTLTHSCVHTLTHAHACRRATYGRLDGGGCGLVVKVG